MDLSPTDTILAAMPPLLVLLLLLARGWSGARAGMAGWLLALLIAVVRFGADEAVLINAHIRALVLTVDVVYIIWTALFLYLVVQEAGALARIAAWFSELTEDATLRVLWLGWVFASFLQGVGGFGIPIAVVAPLLMGLGLAPLPALVIPSLGHAWAATFGSLGSSFIALLGVTGETAADLGEPAAVLLGAAALGAGAMVAHAYGGWAALRRVWPAVLLIGGGMAITQYMLVRADLWRLGSTGAGLTGMVMAFAWTRRQRQATPTTTKRDPGPSLLLASSGYLALVLLAIMVKGLAPLTENLGSWRLSLALSAVTTARGWETAETASLGLAPLTHTGSILLVSALFAALVYRHAGWLGKNRLRPLLANTMRRGHRSALGILTMMMMAIVMTNAGMTHTLAEGLSDAVPARLYHFVASAIGAVGAFITGSNTNSNAILGALQRDTALLLGLSLPWVLALQTASAGLASMLAPAKILVGMSTVGIPVDDQRGTEGRVLLRLLKYGGLLLLGITLLAYGLRNLGS